MGNQVLFNIRYAYQNIRRGGLWTVFAVICIAAGVAAVVALRGLGLSMEDALVDTVRDVNKGDITLSRGSDNPFSAITGIDGVGADSERSRERSVFSEDQIALVEDYVAERGGEIAVYKQASGVQVSGQNAVTQGRPQFVSVFLIDPATYSPLGPIETIDPPGMTVNDLLVPGENVIVVSENFAEAQDLSVGDTARVSGTDAPFTVVGIVDAAEQASLFDLIASFFGFAYLHEDRAELIGERPQPNRISMTLPGYDVSRAADELFDLLPRGTDVRDIVDLQEGLGTFADILGRLIVITGVGALVIGGVGIINTMLVMVRRRTMEIATLKTFGLKGGQIAWLFTWEAVILGVLGSLAGVLLGTALGGVVNQFGEAFLQQSLAWRFYPEAALYGLVLGLSVTVVFGVMPVLTATKVRPNIVLRPNEAHIPVVGWLQSVGVLMITVLAIGIMIGSILVGVLPPETTFFGLAGGDVIIPMLFGIFGTAGAFVVIGLLTLAMWVIVWLVSRLPAFGVVDLRLALRNLTSRRWRTATTLLALSAGMYALSSITFVSQSLRDTVNFQLSNTLGGNVLVFPLTTVFSSADLAEPVINARANSIEGVESITRSDFYFVELEALNGEAIESETFTFTDENGDEQTVSEASFLLQARRSNNPLLNSGQLSAGRDLTPEDADQNVIVVQEDVIGEGAVRLSVGDTMLLEVDGRETPFEVVGLLSSGNVNFSQAFAPIGTFPTRSEATIFTMSVAEENLDNALVELTTLPTVFVLDISFIDGLIQRLIDQFSALPTVVGLMALLAAAAIMANTVLLATLERRKQIGVLKAVGLKSRRVLGVLLLENTMVALLGCLIGIGLSAINSSILSALGLGQIEAIPPGALPLVAVLVGAALVISWASTFASAGVVTRESVTTVLRYD
jgi:putative ABC transport system permease protein